MSVTNEMWMALVLVSAAYGFLLGFVSSREVIVKRYFSSRVSKRLASIVFHFVVTLPLWLFALWTMVLVLMFMAGFLNLSHDPLATLSFIVFVGPLALLFGFGSYFYFKRY